MKGRKFKENNLGITLIALVVTIIVLLILAGVSISMIVGDNGILKQAQNSKVKNRAGTVEETRDLWKTEKITDETLGTTTAQNLEEVAKDLRKQNILTDSEKEDLVNTGKVTIGEKTIVFESIRMYQDLASDEDGATEGKVHIGDYVNYKVFSSSLLKEVAELYAEILVKLGEIDESEANEILSSLGEVEESEESSLLLSLIGELLELEESIEATLEGESELSQEETELYEEVLELEKTELQKILKDYTYISKHEDTGLEYAITSDSKYKNLTIENDEGMFGEEEIGQIFYSVLNEDLKWRVIGVDGDNILIIPETPINSCTTVNGKAGYFMYGAYAYENCITELNNIAKIYANGNGASKARGLTIDDVNKITGLTADGTTLTPKVTDLFTLVSAGDAEAIGYGNEITGMRGWTPSAWLKATDKTKPTTAITGKVTGYAYNGTGESVGLRTEKSSILYNLIFGESNSKSYWLASHGVSGWTGADGGIVFGPGSTGDGEITNCTGTFLPSINMSVRNKH